MSRSLSHRVRYTDQQRSEASDWFALIRDAEDLSAENLHAWLRWLEALEGNRAAFEATEEAWHRTPRSLLAAMPTPQELASDPYEGDQSVRAWRTSLSPENTVEAPTRVTRFGSRWTWALAAMLLVALNVLGFAWLIGRSPVSGSAEEYLTQTGEQLEITLADGSHVWLGAQSRLLVTFTKSVRGMQLKSGEAYFSVKKDHTRPFVVHVLFGDIVAVGTAFDVRTTANRVTVAVTEGVVRVHTQNEAPSERPLPADIKVAKGQQATFEARVDQVPKVTSSSDPGERSRWRSGVLIYRNEPLRDVVADLSRYSERRIETVDTTTGDLRFSGVVYKSAIDEWAAALPESFPVALENDGTRIKIKMR